MMRRIGLIAARDFLSTVGNKGFLIGLLIFPALMLGVISLAPRILNSQSPQITGEVAVIDPTGRVSPELRKTLAPEAITARRTENTRRALEQAGPGAQAAAQGATQSTAAAPVPSLTIVDRPGESTLDAGQIDAAKNWLINKPGERHLALVVIRPDAVQRAGDTAEYGSYDLYVSTALDDSTEGVIHDSLRQALVTSRLQASSFDQAAVEATMRVTRPNSIIVAEGGEQKSARGFNRALPFILGILMFMGVMIGGQTLMTSTIEEKSSRVVEVLLAAVSPVELMWGKLLGQLGAGLLVMAVYTGLGIMALFQFALLGLLDPMLVVYLIVFFLITYLVYGSLMMSIGAAVNQMADAQSLMGPIMILLVAPYVMAPIIGQAPNSTFSVAMSFIPPVNTFAMMARLASGTPPPAWQAWLTVLVGAVAASATVWFAAKIFKIGLLMHGKPPNFATLIRWARMA
jgi:ABC-2 type transport system permease protein